ncbi:hypothetical protein CspHIS471_0502880 [Cutaneotrichosporon sp. HIS471]|nr:hypothetical protein CspHIS471_0502880 [Cutaneotrichosporon sp. HIS471]
MFVVLWTSADQSLCIRDQMPENAHRHCRHCRPSPRRPSCAPCCPHSSPAVGFAVCLTPPPSPTVTYTTLPPSPRTTAHRSRSPSPYSLGQSWSHGRTESSVIGLCRESDVVPVHVAIAATAF